MNYEKMNGTPGSPIRLSFGGITNEVDITLRDTFRKLENFCHDTKSYEKPFFMINESFYSDKKYLMTITFEEYDINQ
jgi:hypothetical protein